MVLEKFFKFFFFRHYFYRFEAKYDFTPLIDEAVANKETMVLQTVEVVAEEEKFEELF